MNLKIFSSLAFSLFVFIVFSGYSFAQENSQQINPNAFCAIEISSITDNLDNDEVEETITFLSPNTSVWGGSTRIFINTKDQGMSVNGYYRTSKVIAIKRDFKILVVELVTGKSINTLVYHYNNKRLIRIPVSTEHLPNFAVIVTRNVPEFKDTDNDGSLEMLVYQRYFPPEAKRLVEVYKFDSDSFNKQLEYEEITEDIYL